MEKNKALDFAHTSSSLVEATLDKEKWPLGHVRKKIQELEKSLKESQ